MLPLSDIDMTTEVAMNPKKMFAALALAGTLAAGGATIGAGLAGAQETPATEPSSSSSGTFTVECDTAAQWLGRADARVAEADEKVDRMTARRDELVAKGDDRRAARLTRIIDRVSGRLTDIDGRLDEAHARLAEVCPGS